MKRIAILLISCMLFQFVVAQQPGKVNYDKSWSDEDITVLVDKLGTTVFPRQKIDMLQEALKSKPGGFTSDQSVTLLKAFKTSTEMAQVVSVIDERILGMTTAELKDVLSVMVFPSHKLEVLDILRSTITDEENKFDLVEVFKTSKDKAKANEILSKVKQPRSYIYGTVTAKKVVFVVDISGSMLTEFETPDGETMTRYDFVKHELEKALLSLDDGTEFNMVFFSDQLSNWKSDLVSADQYNIAEALSYMNEKEPGGATNIWGALQSAFENKDLDAIYFLTDGVPTAGAETNVNSIINDVKQWNTASVKIHATAFLSGYSDKTEKKESRDLMYKLASISGGVYRAID